MPKQPVCQGAAFSHLRDTKPEQKWPIAWGKKTEREKDRETETEKTIKKVLIKMEIIEIIIYHHVYSTVNINNYFEKRSCH